LIYLTIFSLATNAAIARADYFRTRDFLVLVNFTFNFRFCIMPDRTYTTD